MKCLYPLCESQEAAVLVKVVTETRNNVGRNGKVEVLNEIFLCREHFSQATLSSIGPRMREFGEEALSQQGFRRPFYHRLEAVALDSPEALQYLAKRPTSSAVRSP